MKRIPDRIDSKFRYVLLAATRAEQLMRGAAPKVHAAHGKQTKIAMEEVLQEAVRWDYGPEPAREPAADTEAEEPGGAVA
jgi:DNA-directed RNA polymerase omega subunit